jgi:AcrR family transcriptional regulator
MTDKARSLARRRVPQQERSRSRFERILEVTGDLVVAGGVEAVNTRLIASAAEIPVASLYQYFADKEQVLLALVARDLEEMKAEVAKDLGRLSVLSVRRLVETTMQAHINVYRRRPAFVVIWLRGRTNQSINDFCRAHNRRIAHEVFDLAQRAGMVLESTTRLHAELAVEVSDRLLQVAFERSLEGDPVVIDEAVAMMCRYLEAHATPEGIAGVRNPATNT